VEKINKKTSKIFLKDIKFLFRNGFSIKKYVKIEIKNVNKPIKKLLIKLCEKL
jgi:hypothetical protein